MDGGYLPVCKKRWFLRFVCLLKPREQIWHLKGHDPLWTYMWERRSPGVGNDLEQRLHLCGFPVEERERERIVLNIGISWRRTSEFVGSDHAMFCKEVTGQCSILISLHGRVPHVLDPARHSIWNMELSCKNALRTRAQCFGTSIRERREEGGAAYLYVSHSVIVEIGTCCESLAANGTFCCERGIKEINEKLQDDDEWISCSWASTYREVSRLNGCVDECLTSLTCWSLFRKRCKRGAFHLIARRNIN